MHATTPAIAKLMAAPVLVSELPAGATHSKRYLESPDSHEDLRSRALKRLLHRS